jgi:ABC-type multidrug transport system ATPase subunit
MYNGEGVNQSTPQCQQAYISQYDLHQAEMTVRETIDFSSEMLGTNSEFGKVPFYLHVWYVFTYGDIA